MLGFHLNLLSIFFFSKILDLKEKLLEFGSCIGFYPFHSLLTTLGNRGSAGVGFDSRFKAYALANQCLSWCIVCLKVLFGTLGSNCSVVSNKS